MTNYRKTSATAEILRGLPRKPDAAQMVAQALHVPAPEPMQWYEAAIELHRHHQALEDEREAQRRAKEEAATPPRNPVDALRAALAGSGSGTALNSAALLRAALGGSAGTVNGA
jgi:hypothetical protein